jgi:DNA-binding transcriptional LysR family regulator
MTKGADRSLSSVDLNLLLVLHVVLRERSATAAAKRLSVTQSAVSNSLARLRHIFGDPLVVRGGNGLVATPKAQELAPRLAAAVEHLERIIQEKHSFDPLQATRRFTLACSDWTQVCDVPTLFEAFSRKLPRASLRVVSIDQVLGNEGLTSGEIDVAMGPREASAGLHCEQLYTQGAVLVVREGNPLVGDSVTPEEFNRLPQVDTLVVQGQPGASHQVATEFFARHGLVRNVVLAVSHFSAVAMAVARTNCVAALPERPANGFCQVLPLRQVRMEIMEKLRFETAMIWHQRTETDPGSRFFRGILLETLARPKQATAIRRGKGRSINRRDDRHHDS